MLKLRSLASPLLVVTLYMSASTMAFSADGTNVVGTWKGEANVAVIGANPHHNTQDPEEVRLVKTEFTFIIEKQEGQNFSGYRFSKNGFKDRFVGAFRSHFRSGVIADSDGTRIFEMVGKDLMDSCYTHTVSANGTSTVAECNELKRQ